MLRDTLRKRSMIKDRQRNYPVGTRIAVVHMDGIYAPFPGTKGTVTGIDDDGNLMVDWDNGSSLKLDCGKDECRVLDPVFVTCYGNRQRWEDRQDALLLYRRAMAASEGSEHRRYERICCALMDGEKECSDE